MKLQDFHKKFETVPQEARFRAFAGEEVPQSLFIISQKLKMMTMLRKYFEEQEEHLLRVAEVGFKKLENGK